MARRASALGRHDRRSPGTSRRRAGLGAVLIALVAGSAWVSAQPTASGTALTMKGQVVLITGSTDGLGREVARRVAALGAHVIVHGRDEHRGQQVVTEIAREGTGSARFYAADFASLDEVRRFAGRIRNDYDRLDVLVNNAGILLRDRQVSRDGHELQFAVNYLAGFLLTRTLLPLVTASAPARIVNVSSLAQSPIDFDDVMLEREGRAAEGYGQSKLAQILFTMDLAEELDPDRVTVTALHPATMMNTSMVRRSGMPVRSTVDEGATAVMHQITGEGIQSGQFFDGLKPSRANAQAYDTESRTRLRQLSMTLTGLDKAR